MSTWDTVGNPKSSNLLHEQQPSKKPTITYWVKKTNKEYYYKRMADSGFNLSRTVNIIIEEAAAESERSN